MSDQENLWRGGFGDAYTERNQGGMMVARNVAFFAEALARAHRIDSVLELGANRGANLSALRRLLPEARLEGIEINESAHEALAANPDVNSSICCSLLDGAPAADWDLVLTKGVLIHVPPHDLTRAYEVMHSATRRYVLIAEYHAATPTPVRYRGHDDALWRRDFAADMLDAYSDLTVVDYGFRWARDPMWPQDSLVWTLMEKR